MIVCLKRDKRRKKLIGAPSEAMVFFVGALPAQGVTRWRVGHERG